MHIASFQIIIIGVFYSTTENPGKRSKTESVGWIVRHRATLATPFLAKAESAGPWPLLHLSLAEAQENSVRSRQFDSFLCPAIRNCGIRFNHILHLQI